MEVSGLQPVLFDAHIGKHYYINFVKALTGMAQTAYFVLLTAAYAMDLRALECSGHTRWLLHLPTKGNSGR